jgi:hypothetical protein
VTEPDPGPSPGGAPPVRGALRVDPRGERGESQKEPIHTSWVTRGQGGQTRLVESRLA